MDAKYFQDKRKREQAAKGKKGYWDGMSEHQRQDWVDSAPIWFAVGVGGGSILLLIIGAIIFQAIN